MASLSVADLDSLLAMSARRSLKSREWLFRQESPAEWLYLVISGGLRLARAAGEDREATIRCVERGGTLGELSMVSPAGRYLYSAEALVPCHLLALPTSACRDILDNHPACRAEYLGRLATELTDRLEDLALLTQANAMSRLVSFLIRQLPHSSRPAPQVVRLSVPRRWLAEQLAMTPETLSRLLIRLRAQDAIDSDRISLVIINQANLRQLLRNAA